MADPTVYADRYEIVREIARGGMSNVYLARDTKLDRAVALKVLPAELSRDPAFVERFRLEAQAAASLNDPTIVAVYDWGQEQDTSFIVMEYVEGSTLRESIARGPMDPVEAAGVASDIARALATAHRRGVIHRDIKPGNVLITPSGEVKVADFGIARANGVGDGLTRTGAVMGTATYFSPEQAQGLPVDARSDIYSLGVVLYEMVTGAVPFVGDSAVSVAFLHVREPVAPPSRRRPGVPAGLESIILTCLAKEPDARYQSADELRADLMRFTRGQDVVGGPVTAAVAAADATMAMSRTTVAPAVTALPASRRRSKGPVFLVLGLLLALVAVVAFLLVQVFQQDSAAPTFAVRDVVGMQVGPARKSLEQQGFKVTVRRVSGNNRPVGEVFEQDPQGGELREKGTTVTLKVSDGTGTIKVPRLAGLTLADATARLEKVGLIATPSPLPSETVAIGTVIRSDPKGGTSVALGTEVIVFVSQGPAPVKVPNVVGLDQVDATAQLVGAGFTVTKTLEPSTSVPAGRVIRTEPAPGELQAKNTAVTMVVSSGPRQVTVPDVVGMSQGAATSALESAGLKVSVAQTVSTPANVGKVISQNPAGNTKADDGSSVTITVGIAAPTTTSSSTPTTSTP